MPRTPLTSRPLDLLYTLFFLIHIPATLLLDLQALYPPSLVPRALREGLEWYLEVSGDPVVAGAMRGVGWVRAFFWVEAVFQLPVFFVGLYGLYYDSPLLPPLLLLYASSTCTTLLPCLLTILSLPSLPLSTPPTLTLTRSTPADTLSLTAFQRTMLLASYGPFLVVPLVMLLDMGLRTARLVREGERAMKREEGGKRS